MNSSSEELIKPLRFYAARLDKISTPAPSATVFYEVMSGALVWSDEKLEGMPPRATWGLRPLFAYRSSLIVGAPREEWRSYWETCVSMFPHWVGFLPERSVGTPELLRALKIGKKKLDHCLKELK